MLTSKPTPCHVYPQTSARLTLAYSLACHFFYSNRYLCDNIADKFKEESSLSKAGMWATLLTDVLVTARERAYGSIADQSVDRLCALASRLDLAVREDLFGDAAVRDVQRWVRLFFFFPAVALPPRLLRSVRCKAAITYY